MAALGSIFSATVGFWRSSCPPWGTKPQPQTPLGGWVTLSARPVRTARSHVMAALPLPILATGVEKVHCPPAAGKEFVRCRVVARFPGDQRWNCARYCFGEDRRSRPPEPRRHGPTLRQRVESYRNAARTNGTGKRRQQSPLTSLVRSITEATRCPDQPAEVPSPAHRDQRSPNPAGS